MRQPLLAVRATAILLALLPPAVAAQSAAPSAAASAPAPYPLDAIPDKEPFNTPYGAPIPLQRAQSLISAALAEAGRRGWPMNVAVVDSGTNLVAFARMDGAQLASVAVSQHKARTAVKFRRPTRVFEESVQKSGYLYQLTLDDVVASRGGFPIVEDGRVVGGLGCSGGTGSQDDAVCQAALTALGDK
jgi:uncharacterized protein GlcG (DUF336 family)